MRIFRRRETVQPMIVACGGCGARFHMDPALFQGSRGVRIRCRKCGERIELLNPEAPPESAADPTPKPEPAGAATPEPAAEPAHPDVPPWLEAGPGPGAPPGTAPEAEAGTAAIRSVPEVHPAEKAARVRPPGASDRRSPRWRTVLLAVSCIFLLAGGAFVFRLAGGGFLFRDAKSSRNLLRNLFAPSGPENTASVVTPAGTERKPAYEIRGMESFHAEAFGGGKLFVIQGTVANVGKGPSRGILLRATLLGKDNQALLDNAVFAGNRVDNTTLRHADREVILKILTVRDGAGNANRDIPAGSSLPFMAVFFDPPAQFESFAVKAADAE